MPWGSDAGRCGIFWVIYVLLPPAFRDLLSYPPPPRPAPTPRQAPAAKTAAAAVATAATAAGPTAATAATTPTATELAKAATTMAHPRGHVHFFKHPSISPCGDFICSIICQIRYSKRSARPRGAVFCDFYMAPAHFGRARGSSFPLLSVPIWSYGIWPFLDMPPFICSRRMGLAGLEGRIPCGYQEVSSFARRKWSPGSVVNLLPVRDRGPGSLSDDLTGHTVGKSNSGRLERSWPVGAEQVSRRLYHGHRD
jgi:hypothetical protein